MSQSDPNMTMFSLLARSAEAYPAHTAYTFQGSRTDYRSLLERVHAAARGLYAMGIRRGDRVALCLPNCPQVLHCLYGLNRIGAVAHMIHPLSAPAEIGDFLKTSGSRAILTLDRLYAKVAAATPSGVRVLVTSLADALPFPKKLLYTKMPAAGYTRWRELIRCAGDLPAWAGAADDPAVILCSGGTTGNPKGILLSNDNFNALALQTAAASGLDHLAGRKMLAILPNFHGFGLGLGIHTPLVSGAACILVPRFSSKGFAGALIRQRPDIILGVPTMFEALLGAKSLEGKDLSFLQGIFCGGDSLSPTLQNRVDAFLRRHGCSEQIRQGYGATECVAASCLMPRHMTRPGAVGLPFSDTFYKIVTPGTDQPLPAGEEGEICISGPTVMLGYLDDPAETADALHIHADGRQWLHTGDLGCMDGDGYVYFRQRIKRMIVTSGYNVYPAQLETVLESHPKVRLACVIGVPDAYRGQRVRAYIVPETGAAASEDLKQEILSHCAQFIAQFALPRDVEFRQELPMTPLGKVAYRQLEALAQEETP